MYFHHDKISHFYLNQIFVQTCRIIFLFCDLSAYLFCSFVHWSNFVHHPREEMRFHRKSWPPGECVWLNSPSPKRMRFFERPELMCLFGWRTKWVFTRINLDFFVFKIFTLILKCSKNIKISLWPLIRFILSYFYRITSKRFVVNLSTMENY